MEKIIHQVWIGHYEMPERDLAFTKKVKEQNPDYEYIFWDNDNFPNFPKELEKLKNMFVEQRDWIQLAHLIRLYVIKKFGGIHIDCDYELHTPLSEYRKFEELDGFLHLNYWSQDPTICNSFFGFSRDHEMINYICDQMSDQWMGPNFFGCVVKEYLGLDCRVDLDDRVVHSKLAEKNIGSNTSLEELREFAIHHGSATWIKENREKLLINKKFKGL